MPAINNLLVALPATPEHLKKFQAAAPGTHIVQALPADVTAEMVRQADVIIGNVPRELLSDAPNLHWLQLTSAGADPYVVPGILAKDVLLTNSVGAYGQAVSEHTAAMVFALMKKLPLYRDDQFSGTWGEHGTVTSPVGSNVLVLGAGNIGICFASIMHSLTRSMLEGPFSTIALAFASSNETYRLVHSIERTLPSRSDIAFGFARMELLNILSTRPESFTVIAIAPLPIWLFTVTRFISSITESETTTVPRIRVPAIVARELLKRPIDPFGLPPMSGEAGSSILDIRITKFELFAWIGPSARQ